MFDNLTDVELARLTTKLHNGYANLLLIAESKSQWAAVRDVEHILDYAHAETNLRTFIMLTNNI